MAIVNRQKSFMMIGGSRRRRANHWEKREVFLTR